MFNKISALETRYEPVTCKEIIKYEADLNVTKCEGRLETDNDEFDDEKWVNS